MTVSAAQLNRSTLLRQLLLRREQRPVRSAVRALVGLQAQEPASPYVALWNRLDGFAPAELDEALNNATVVRATVMRITLHLVDRDDCATFRAAVLPVLRGARLGDERFTRAGRSFAEVDAWVDELLTFLAEPRTTKEVEAFIGAAFGAAAARPVWWAVRTYAPLRRTPTGGPWSFDGPGAFGADAPGAGAEPPRDEAVRSLARRYLAAFGPATVRDLAQFCLLNQATARRAMGPDDVVGQLEQEDGPPLYDLRGAALATGEEPAPPRLLGMWESILLAYHDRSRIVPKRYRPVVLRRNGNVLPVLLVDGHVAGVWRCTEQGVECTAFERLPDHTWDGLEHEARSLRALLEDRDPQPWRRYHHWWDKGLPGAQVRTLGG